MASSGCPTKSHSPATGNHGQMLRQFRRKQHQSRPEHLRRTRTAQYVRHVRGEELQSHQYTHPTDERQITQETVL